MLKSPRALSMAKVLLLGWIVLEALGAEPTAADDQVANPTDRKSAERFMVTYQGCALLGSDGEQKERLESITNAAGAISPDGRWVVFSKSEPATTPGKWQRNLVIQSRDGSSEITKVPLIWGTTGSSLLPIWSADSQRILICEQGQFPYASRGSSFRVCNVTTKVLTDLKLRGWWPSDWSPDGKRVLATLPADEGSFRLVWVYTDGTGMPEFITSDQEVAYGARLSPDGRRILCMLGPKPANGEAKKARLQVIDLTTNTRTMIDRPGHTDGYCWSSDGLKVAYTWQMPLHEPREVKERKTYLITCDPDGSNRKTITSRRYEVPQNNSGKDGVITFFSVVSWWR